MSLATVDFILSGYYCMYLPIKIYQHFAVFPVRFSCVFTFAGIQSQSNMSNTFIALNIAPVPSSSEMMISPLVDLILFRFHGFVLVVFHVTLTRRYRRRRTYVWLEDTINIVAFDDDIHAPCEIRTRGNGMHATKQQEQQFSVVNGSSSACICVFTVAEWLIVTPNLVYYLLRKYTFVFSMHLNWYALKRVPKMKRTVWNLLSAHAAHGTNRLALINLCLFVKAENEYYFEKYLHRRLVWSGHSNGTVRSAAR